MKAGGRMTKLMEEEDSFMQMEIFTKEIGLMIKHMALVHTHIPMEQLTEVNGTATSKMGLA